MSTITYVPYTFPFIVNPTPLGAMVFMSGSTNSSDPPTTSVDKYDYNANTWSNGSQMVYSGSGRCSQSNRVYALAMYGTGSQSTILTDRYYFAADVTETATNASITGASGTMTSLGFADAMVCGWGTGSGNRTSRYYYATDTVDRGNTPIGGITEPYGASGPNMGIIVPETSSNSRSLETYFWPSDTHIVNTTQLPSGSVPIGQGVGFGNMDIAILTKSLSGKPCYKMPWASGVVTTAGSLNAVVSQHSQSASTPTFGIMSGGQRSGDLFSVVSERYNFATDTTTLVANAITPRRQGCGASDNPGNF